MNDSPPVKKILILSANPKGTSQLRLDEEVREIKEGLLRAKHGRQFSIESFPAVRYRDLRRAILDNEPQILHFSGHGVGEEGLVFEDETGQAKLVDAEALAELFKLFSDQLECVVLNACYSEVQARAIAQHIPYVVGMNQAIGDKAAIEFSVGFYDALGAGKSYEIAYKFGCNAIHVSGSKKKYSPIWLKKMEMTNTATSPASENPASSQRVFISYRTQEPDKSLAQTFHEQLKAAGHESFMAAESIDWGENWVDRIDEELKHCDYFVLLLSEQSASSDMVAGEVRTAKRLQDQWGKPVILPIRVNLPLDDPLNYELRSTLQTIQQKSWESPDDTPNLLQEILGLIAVGVTPEPVKDIIAPVVMPTSKKRPPLPVADLELPGGTMLLDSEFYIKREPWDSRCVQEIENRAGLVRIKAPRQMGKTSLLARIRAHADELGYQTVTLDFLETDETAFSNLNLFLKRICALISLQLNVSPQQVKECWAEDLLGPKENCSNYFKNCLFPEINTSLLLLIDELDRLFPYEAVSKAFLTLLRSWNEKAKVNETWAKLRIAIAHSTESYVVLDTNSSPFNVGLAVELPEFTPEQVLELLNKHGLNWDRKKVAALMSMLGGHPYLVRLALYHLAQQDLTLTELLAEAPTDGGIYGEHLRRHLWNLQQHPELARAFKQVISSDNPVLLEPMLAFKLNGMGLVNLQGNEVVLRHEPMYRPYFCSRLKIKS